MANLAREMERGGRADALLNNEMYKEAVSRVRQGIHDRWAESPLSDKDGQHALRLMLKLLDDIEGNIREVSQTGKLASLQHEEEVKQQNIFKRTLTRMGVRS